MRTLVLGAGALGGYFGARLLAAGSDVTFLVRESRAAALARTGLVVKSAFGDLAIAAPPIVPADRLQATFDVVLVGCKAYDLEPAMDAIAPAVGAQTAILPMLNGMRHLDALQARFGAARVLGGLCMISATLDEQGAVRHLNDRHSLVFGELDGSTSPRVEAIGREFSRAGFDGRASARIVQEMWEKWVFIASLAGINCLMRAPVGTIVAAGGAALSLALLDECSAIAAANGFAPRPEALQMARDAIAAPGSPMVASMLKDVERGAPVEADHVLGDLLDRGASGDPRPVSLLRAAYVHLKAYEIGRVRAL